MNNEPMSFEEFKAEWLVRHPGSVPIYKKISTKSEYFWIAFWTMIAIASAVFSGAHTVPAAAMTLFPDNPNRDVIAFVIFLILEMTIFGSAANRRDMKMLAWLLAASMIVTLISNIASSVAAVNANGGQPLDYVSAILIAIITPLVVLASGEMLHRQLEKRAKKQSEYDAEYTALMQGTDATINSAFTRYVNAFKAALPPSIDVNLRKFTSIDRPTPKMKKALAWLEEHPEHLETESRELGNLIGVSHTLANEARKEILYRQNSNGNGSHD